MAAATDVLSKVRALTAPTVCALALSIAAVGASDATLAQTRFNTAQEYYEDASQRASIGETDAAIIQLKNALQLNGDHLPSLMLLGEIYYEDGAMYDASARLSEALLQGAAPGRVVPKLADAYLAQGAYARLLRDLPVDAAPRRLRAEILSARAQAYIGLSKLAEATVTLRNAEAIDPDHVRVRTANVVLAVRQRRLIEAMSLAEALVRDEPDVARVWSTYAATLEATGQLEPAIDNYEQALGIGPNDFDARIALISILMSLGRLDQASEHVTYLRDKTPFDPRGSYFEALIASQTGDTETERSALSTTSELVEAMDPQIRAARPQLQMVGALANFGLGAFELAKTYIESYLEVRAEDRGAERLYATILLELGEEKIATQRLLIMHRRNPGDEMVRALLASAYTQSGDHYRAAELLSGIEGAGSGELRSDAQLGFSLLNAGRHNRGLETLEAVQRQQPRSTSLDLPLAAAYIRTGRWQKAMTLVGELLTQQPDNPNYRNLMGLALLEGGDREEARRQFESVLASEPEFLASRINLIKLSIQDADWETAEAYLNGVPQDKQDTIGPIKERARLALAQGDLEQALRHAERAVQLDNRDLEASEILVRTHLRQNNAQAAEDAARKATTGDINNSRQTPSSGRRSQPPVSRSRPCSCTRRCRGWATFDPVSLHKIARLQSDTGDDQAALYSLTNALRGDAMYVPAREMLLFMLMATGAYEDAEAASLVFSADFPDNALGHLVRGDSLMARSRRRDAIASYDKAAEMGQVVLATLGKYRAYSAMLDDRSAEKVLRDHFEEFGTDVRLEAALSDLLIRNERWDEALAVLNALLERTPDSAVRWNNRAYVRHQLGEEDAYTDAQRAQALAPENPVINDTLGRLLTLAGRPSDALPYLREAVARGEQDYRYRYHLSDALAELGRNKEALRELYYALESESPFRERDEALALRDRLESDASP